MLEVYTTFRVGRTRKDSYRTQQVKMRSSLGSAGEMSHRETLETCPSPLLRLLPSLCPTSSSYQTVQLGHGSLLKLSCQEMHPDSYNLSHHGDNFCLLGWAWPMSRPWHTWVGWAWCIGHDAELFLTEVGHVSSWERPFMFQVSKPHWPAQHVIAFPWLPVF